MITLSSVGALCLGIFISFLMRTFVRKFDEFNVSALRDVIILATGGGVIQLLEFFIKPDSSVFAFYPIGLVIGWVVYTVVWVSADLPIEEIMYVGDSEGEKDLKKKEDWEEKVFFVESPSPQEKTMEYAQVKEYIIKQSELFERKRAVLFEHYENLRDKYVIFQDGEILDSDKDRFDLVERFRLRQNEEGERIRKPIFIQKLSRERPKPQDWANLPIG